MFGYVMVKIVPGEKCFITVLAGIRQSSRKMNVLHMLLKIASVSSRLATKCTFKTFRAKRWFLDKVGGEDDTGSP